MKNLLLSAVLLMIVISCSSRSEETPITPVTPPSQSTTVTFNKDINPIIQSQCLSCHSTGGENAAFPLTNYVQVKAAIDNIIIRIGKPAGDPLKMPKGGSLSAAQISLINKWKTDGLIEQ